MSDNPFDSVRKMIKDDLRDQGLINIFTSIVDYLDPPHKLEEVAKTLIKAKAARVAPPRKNALHPEGEEV